MPGCILHVRGDDFRVLQPTRPAGRIAELGSLIWRLPRVCSESCFLAPAPRCSSRAACSYCSVSWGRVLTTLSGALSLRRDFHRIPAFSRGLRGAPTTVRFNHSPHSRLSSILTLSRSSVSVAGKVYGSTSSSIRAASLATALPRSFLRSGRVRERYTIGAGRGWLLPEEPLVYLFGGMLCQRLFALMPAILRRRPASPDHLPRIL